MAPKFVSYPLGEERGEMTEGLAQWTVIASDGVKGFSDICRYSPLGQLLLNPLIVESFGVLRLISLTVGSVEKPG